MDIQALYKKYKKHGKESLTLAEGEFILQAEARGGVFPGELPFNLAHEREKALDSPSFLATEIVDPFYKEHFEPIHYALMDEVAAPYLIGETVKIEGQSYDPTQQIGLLVLFSRTTFKSTIAGLMLHWIHLFRKIRQRLDARSAYIHQVIGKAIERGEVIRNIARHNPKFRERFPEFKPPAGEWDRQDQWRWPNFTTYTAAEYSFRAYGETSEKTGGHYTERIVDDWETEESVTTADMLEKSHSRFRGLDNLKDRTRRFNPLLVMGTTYSYDGTHSRIMRDGGYLVWKMPAHTGSPKRIFDLCSIDDREEKGRMKIEAGLRNLERDPPGKLNFPGLLPWRELYLSARAQGSFIYNTQLLLDPMPEGEQRFDHKAVDAAWEREIPGPGEMWLYLRCDPALSKKKHNDECAIGAGGVDWRGWRWSVDGWGGREKRPTEIVRKLFALARKWQDLGYQVKNIGVEAVQFQEALAQLCRDGVAEREPKFHGEHLRMLKSPCPVRSIHRSPDMRKPERILEMEGPISRREFKIWVDNPVGQRQAAQIKNFPHDRDDWLDVIHDFWEATLVPPREMPPDPKAIHPAILKLLKRLDKNAALTGTSNQVRLTSWR